MALVAIALLGLTSSGLAQDEGRLDLLIVDETRTFEASLLVNTFAGALKETGQFDVEAEVVDVASSFEDPLGPNESDAVYDIILVIPQILEKREMMQLWVASCPYSPGGPAELRRGVETIQDLVDEGSRGQVAALGVHDDALPALFSTIFADHGWLSCN